MWFCDEGENTRIKQECIVGPNLFIYPRTEKFICLVKGDRANAVFACCSSISFLKTNIVVLLNLFKSNVLLFSRNIWVGVSHLFFRHKKHDNRCQNLMLFIFAGYWECFPV